MEKAISVPVQDQSQRKMLSRNVSDPLVKKWYLLNPYIVAMNVLESKSHVYAGLDSYLYHFTDTLSSVLKKLQIRGLSRGSSTPGEFVKGSGGVTVIEANTRKLVTGLTAPTEKTLIPWLKAHPTYKVHIPSDKGDVYYFICFTFFLFAFYSCYSQ